MVLRLLSDSLDSFTNKLPNVVVSPIETVKQQLQTTPLCVLKGDIVNRVDSAARRVATKELIDELLLARSALSVLTKTQKKRRKRLIEELLTKTAGSPLEKRSDLVEDRLKKTKKTLQKHYLPAYGTYKSKQLKAERAEQLIELLETTTKRFDLIKDDQQSLAKLFVPQDTTKFDLSDRAKSTKKKLHDAAEKEITHLYRLSTVSKKFDRKVADLMKVSKELQTTPNDTKLQTKKKQLTKELNKLYHDIDSYYKQIENNTHLQETIREKFTSSVDAHIDTQQQHLIALTKKSAQQIKQLTKEVDEAHTKRAKQVEQLTSITNWLTKLSEEGVDAHRSEELLTPEPAIYQQHSQVMINQLVSRAYKYVYLMRDLLVEQALLDFKHVYLDTQLQLRKEQRIMHTLTDRLLRKQLTQIKTIRTNMVEIDVFSNSSLPLTDKIESLVKKTTSLQEDTQEKITTTSSLKRTYSDQLDKQTSERKAVTTSYDRLETDLIVSIYVQEIDRLKTLEEYVKQIKQAAKKTEKKLVPEYKKAQMRCEEAEQTASLRATAENKKQAKQCKKQVEQVELLKELVAHTYEFHATLHEDITDLLADYTTELGLAKKKEKALTTQLKKHILLIEKQELRLPIHTIDPA